MGCYEIIYFKCPSCGEQLSAQSKSGPCEMDNYEHTDVPIDVARDANRHAPYFCDCGKLWRFEAVTDRVSLKLVELAERWEKKC